MSSIHSRTIFHWFVLPILLGGLLWPLGTVRADEKSIVQVGGTRRVNAPYFEGDVLSAQAAIFWFGRVTPTENSIDVRVGYNDEHLYVRVSTIDRRLWYDTSPSTEDLTAWDAVSLFLNLNGNAGDVPDADSYRFDAQLRWEAGDDYPHNYQASYRGGNDGWIPANLSFTTPSNWNGDAPNTNGDDRGWTVWIFVPFSTLGLAGPPSQGTVWGLGLISHDRDDAQGSPVPSQFWPEALYPVSPRTWGQLHFGSREYVAPPAWPGASVTIRQGLNGATVMDADIGGGTDCGAPAWPEYFPTWGDLNYPSSRYVNVQNVGQVSEWPCFSRYYVTFPLNGIPPHKVILSAQLTMYQWGNAGEGANPQPSFIQVHSVDSAWDENSLTWNNAPRALENIAGTWAGVFPEYPGEPRTWDVSGAAADAYAAGIPLRLALYESDIAFHSGKYFWSSDVEDYYQEMRPTLVVTWGQPLAQVQLTASPSYGDQGDFSTYTLSFYGTGNDLLLTASMPDGLSAPTGFELEGTSQMPLYNAQRHEITWSDAPPMGQRVTIRYLASITTLETKPLPTTATLEEAGGESSSDDATVIANPLVSYGPLVPRND